MHLDLLAISFAFLAVLLGGFALFAFARALRMKSEGVTTQGRVVARASAPDGSFSVDVVEYVVSGVAYRVRSSSVDARAADAVGESIPVLYRRNAPNDAYVMRSGDPFAAAFALLVAFVLIGGLASVLLYALVRAR